MFIKWQVWKIDFMLLPCHIVSFDFLRMEGTIIELRVLQTVSKLLPRHIVSDIFLKIKGRFIVW